MRIGYQFCNVNKIAKDSVCPLCKKRITNVNNCGFFLTRLTVEGLRESEQEKKQFEIKVDDDKFTTFEESDDNITNWEWLEITAHPLQ